MPEGEFTGIKVLDKKESYKIQYKYRIWFFWIGRMLRKIVKGRHVVFSDGKWKKKSNKRYIWIYTLKKPVVPGDILLVNTKKSRAYICVDRIEYAAGQGFCSRYNTVKKHMNMRMEEGEYTNDGK